MEELARNYARALFESARDAGVLDRVRSELDAVTQALRESRELRLFFNSPYFSRDEKRAGVRKVIEGADERLLRFLELLAERHRFPLLERIRREFERLWAEHHGILDVQVAAPIELDERLVSEIGRRIEQQTGRRVRIDTRVDPELIGGLVVRVGNVVLDASVRNRLERLKREVATAA